MRCIDQFKDLKIIKIAKPRIFVTWKNTEKGRDVNDTYERIEELGVIRYVNHHNRTFVTMKGDIFFDELEYIYAQALK